MWLLQDLFAMSSQSCLQNKLKNLDCQAYPYHKYAQRGSRVNTEEEELSHASYCVYFSKERGDRA